MTTAADGFSTYEAVGIREELHDVISDITPWETPVLSALSSGSCDNRYVEWEVDALPSPATTNYQIEGVNPTIGAVTPPTRVGNRTQISDRSFQITGTDERVKHAGFNSQTDYQALRVGRALITDNESTLIGLYQAQDAGASPSAMTPAPRKLGNFASWIATNTAGADTAPTGDGTDTPTPAMANSTFTEAMLNGVLQACWNEGGQPNKLFVPGSIKALISSTFVGRATAINDMSDRTVVSTVVDIVQTDFGTVTVVPCRLIKSNMALAIDTSKASVLWLRPTFQIPLAVTGDAKAYQIINEFTLKVDNEKAHGAFYGIQA